MDVHAFDRQLSQIQERLYQDMRAVLDRKAQELVHVKLRLEGVSPKSRLQQRKQYLDELSSRMTYRMQQKYTASRNQLEVYISRLEGLSPLARLRRGFAFVADPDGQGITSVRQVQTGDTLQIHVTDGRIQAVVQESETIKRQGEDDHAGE